MRSNVIASFFNVRTVIITETKPNSRTEVISIESIAEEEPPEGISWHTMMVVYYALNVIHIIKSRRIDFDPLLAGMWLYYIF